MKTYGECAYPGLYPKLPDRGFLTFTAGGISHKGNRGPWEQARGQGLVTGMSAAQEPKPESYPIDDVTALAAKQIKKILPPDNETSEQFQQLVKKMLEQAGK